MNIDELKTEWQQVNKKLERSERLNEQLIQSMLKERSRSRVSKIRNDTVLFTIVMFLNLFVLGAIILGNPFDFNYWWQFIPYGILAAGSLLTIISLLKSFKSFNVDINSMSLESFLHKTLHHYEKNKKMESWFGVIILSAGLLSVFSFLPKKLENKGLWPALGEAGVCIVIILVIYFIAFKAGAFKNRKKEGFENDLKEWNELKAMAEELKN
jgi:hypothetical protein